MKDIRCFSCKQIPGYTNIPLCEDCEYIVDDTPRYEGYAYSTKLKIHRYVEAWNHKHSDDKFPQKGYVIHHLNGKLDDSKTQKVTWKWHNQYHWRGDGRGFTGRKHRPDTIEKMRKVKIGKYKGRFVSDEWREKVRLSLIGNKRAKGQPKIREYWSKWWSSLSEKERKEFGKKVSMGRIKRYAVKG